MSDELCKDCGRKHIGVHEHRMVSPEPGQKWKDYRGELIEIITVAKYAHAPEHLMVVYKKVWSGGMPLVCTYREFVSKIDPHGYHSSEIDQGVEKGEVWLFTMVSEPDATLPS